MAKYPYLEIPWDSEKAVVDDIAYRDTFLVPGNFFLYNKELILLFVQ